MATTLNNALSTQERLFRARDAASRTAQLSTAEKNSLLENMAQAIESEQRSILSANQADLDESGIEGALRDRLLLTPQRIAEMAQMLRDVAKLADPVGEILKEWIRPNGLRIRKVRVPIGVIGIIYESRPNVTVDAAVLCTKTGNAVILRGGSESIRSNIAIADALRAGAVSAGLPKDSILMIPKTDRDAVRHMAEMDQYIDLIVPRGGRSLIETVVSYARMPVIKHYLGVCIAYVDREADLDMAVR